MALCNAPQVLGARSIIRAHTAIRPSSTSCCTARGRPDLTGVRHAAQASHLRGSRALHTQWHCATPHKCWRRAIRPLSFAPLSGPPTPHAEYGEREAGSRRRVPYGASTHIPPAGTSRSSLNDLSTSQASAAAFHVVRLPPRRAWAAAVQEQDGGRISPVRRTWRKPASLLSYSTPERTRDARASLYNS